MSQLEMMVEELKLLPASEFQHVADLVHRLNESRRDECRRALAETAGCMTPAEAGDFQASIDAACESIDVEPHVHLD